MSEASERAEQIVANMLLMDVDHAKHLPRFQDALKVFRAAIEQAVRAERERTSTCPSCGSVYELTVTWVEKRVDYAPETGWPSLTVRVPGWSCRVCGFHWFDCVAEDMTEQADAKHREAIRQRSGGKG
jgi:rubrerythrin